jgi:hypothetical protein
MLLDSSRKQKYFYKIFVDYWMTGYPVDHISILNDMYYEMG